MSVNVNLIFLFKKNNHKNKKEQQPYLEVQPNHTVVAVDPDVVVGRVPEDPLPEVDRLLLYVETARFNYQLKNFDS